MPVLLFLTSASPGCLIKSVEKDAERKHLEKIMSVCLFIYLCLSLYLSIYLFIYLSIYLFVLLSISPLLFEPDAYIDLSK